ncbi:ATP-dependent DNA helicase [Leptospira sp. GIMC2001]|uniref:ATP-dependent DNA helicase n=1 Tax=Leptospira sp. GIMC2001 TaxID=1513297 RepID=UPI00234B6693|nr:AAA family ATPase [Leptospira sp. GIMC2001]WCL48547.1 AAA family ATPase [Leptospira sp. GIMC2001]
MNLDPEIIYNRKIQNDLSEGKDIPGFEDLIQSLISAQNKGNLCVEWKPEWKSIIDYEPIGIKIHKFGQKKVVYFSKTFELKTKLENRLIDIIRSAEKINHEMNDSDLVSRAKSIIAKKEKETLSLRLGQKDALINSIMSPFQIISGGPGTGKTTVVAFLLAVLKDLGMLPRLEDIALVAPTGRAAQRLTESIQENLLRMKGLSNLQEEIQFLRGRTLHSLLQFQKYKSKFFYNENRYLPQKLIILDEVSMVDLDMMRALFEALPPIDQIYDGGKFGFRLILIGDPNQLPSVDKGAVLSDFLKGLEKKKKFISKLTESNRQSPSKLRNGKSAIVTMAEDILKLDDEHEQTLFSSSLARIDSQFPATDKIGEEIQYNTELVYFTLPKQMEILSTRQYILKEIWKKYFYPQIERISQWENLTKQNLNEESFIVKFHSEMNKFRCLTIFRKGYWGVESLQETLIEMAIADLRIKKPQNQDKNMISVESVKKIAGKIYFSGMPILITKNDPNRKLFNGDTGYLLRLADTGELRAIFSIDNRMVDFALDTLPAHEPAFILTVHKSQGSEYDSVLLYLPDIRKTQKDDTNHQLVNRQILYTAITRAKNQVIIAGDYNTWNEGVSNSLQRLTGFELK